MNNLIYMMVLLTMCSLSNINSTEVKVSGRVTGEDSLGLPGVSVVVKGKTIETVTDVDGKYEITVPSAKSVLVFSCIGYVPEQVTVGAKRIIDVSLALDHATLNEVVVTGYQSQSKKNVTGAVSTTQARGIFSQEQHSPSFEYEYHLEGNTEEYKGVEDNSFKNSNKNPLSTFSIDVDRASYTNVRRFIQNGQIPPKDAVRIEEMINYFSYDYPQPQGKDPFSISTEISECPWQKKHKLVQIGLQGRKIPVDNLPASNLVFLIDVSGSMNSPEKLPLVKSGFKLLIDQLRGKDQVSIVVYAGAAGQVLPPTRGNNINEIYKAIERLEAGGSTAGGEGIKLAYKIAKNNFKEGGNNRVILATDGDFNVGISSEDELEKLIEEKRETGIFLSVLGFGMGNYKDSKMEVLADKGNGNYAYIDNILEAKKVFISEFGGTLFTIAKDVKLQIEFNPAKVKEYRLVGYENRVLKGEDFNNDKKDAGDLGAGHTVTALYEIIPREGKSTEENIDHLKYQKIKIQEAEEFSGEIMTIKLRYKEPEGSVSKLTVKPVVDQKIKIEDTSDNYRFSASVAAFGMLLRDSEYKGNITYSQILNLAKRSEGTDKEGYRAEFLNLVRSMEILQKDKVN